jgi:hypothetical protein
MKYIKLYEAFGSRGISKTLDFLKSKIDKNQSINFLASLKEFMRLFDYPIDKITDDDISYMNARKALLLKSEGEDKTNNVSFIKFWFSIKDGYLGFTGTGNKIFKAPNTLNMLRENQKFTDDDIEYIKNNIKSTGEIYPIYDYSELKTGDIVIGFFDGRGYRDMSLATIFSQGEGTSSQKFAIQNIVSGTEPSDVRWRVFGRYSWWLASNGDIDSSHYNLHLYKDSSKDLHYVEPKVKEEEFENPLAWNTPINVNCQLTNWGSDRAISNINSLDLKKADFSLVLYYDMLNKDFEPISNIKSSRDKEKEGALALMTDDKIRKQNLEKYISKLSHNLEISKEDLSNLGKILIKALLGEFSFISIHQNRKNSLDILSNICNNLYAIMADPTSESYYIDNIKSYYKQLNQNYYKDLSIALEAKSLIKNSKHEKIFNKIFELGKIISDLIRKENAQSIDDLLILSQKIRSIRDFIFHSQNSISNYYLRNLLSEFFGSTENVKYYLKQVDDADIDENEEIKKLDRIEKYIRAVL